MVSIIERLPTTSVGFMSSLILELDETLTFINYFTVTTILQTVC